jgi:hypothetical protein
MKKFLFFSLALAVGFGWTGCKKEDEGGSTSAPKITLFKIDAPFAAVGTINEATKTITFDYPFGADASAVTVSLTTDPATATVTPSNPVNFSSGSATFTITDGSKSSTYTVTATEGPNPLRLALVGDPANFNDLDPEIKKAYQWALDKYKEKAKYIPFSELKAESIETATMIWFHYTTFPRPDIDNGAPIFPASATGNAKTIITNWYKAGGNLLLTGLAGSYVSQVGRVAPEFGPTNFDIGGDEFIQNPDNWGISFLPGVFNQDDYPAGNDGYYLFKNLTTSPVTFEMVTYNAIFLSDGGAKKNRAHIWDFNRYYGNELPGGCDGPNQKKTRFETDTNSKVRASFEWDPAACGVELGAIVEFNPTTDYKGTTLVIGLGAYEWDLKDGRTGKWKGNVEGITANAIDNFVD